MQDNENRAKIRKKSEFHDRDWTFFSDHGYGKFEIDANRLPSATPHLVGFKRTDNPVDVFFKIFNRDIIEELMNVIADGDPSFWVKWSCVRKQSTVEDVLEYYVIRLMIQSRQDKYGKGNGSNPFRTFYHKKVHDMFPVNAQIMTADDFGSLSNKVIIPCSYARGALSEHLSSLIEGGQSLALDERMHPWRGKSPCVRKIPSKPNPVGHWTTQMCLRMSHPILYCCGMLPFDHAIRSKENRFG